jgi:hypothetical protein
VRDHLRAKPKLFFAAGLREHQMFVLEGIQAGNGLVVNEKQCLST